MAASTWLWVSGLSGLLLAVLVVVLLRKRPGRSAVQPLATSARAGVGVQTASPPLKPEPVRPTAIAFGADPSKPSVTIRPLADKERFRMAKPLELGSGLSGRVGALMQAAPSVLVANAHHGRHLMEVAINGELVRAASGEGFRAFAVDAAHRISENATLFDVGNLTKLVDAAAVWQVASVIVAQKHLADISAKLSVIAEGINVIVRRAPSLAAARLRRRRGVEAVRSRRATSGRRSRAWPFAG